MVKLKALEAKDADLAFSLKISHQQRLYLASISSPGIFFSAIQFLFFLNLKRIYLNGSSRNSKCYASPVEIRE